MATMSFERGILSKWLSSCQQPRSLKLDRVVVETWSHFELPNLWRVIALKEAEIMSLWHLTWLKEVDYDFFNPLAV